MRDVNRRSVLQGTTTTIAGLTLLGSVPIVSADKHEPPAADEVTVGDENVEYIEENPDAGFNYPYFLYTPPSFTTEEEAPRPILVGPNNSPTSKDDYATHLGHAKSSIVEGRPRAVASGLGIPLLVPVFPRYREEPEPWYLYVQHLDPDTFTIEDSLLKRVDLQLLEMFEDATSRLEDDGHTIASEIHIDGFSASGTFTNRFTLLHSDRVNAASYGGIATMTLPKTEIDDEIPVVGNPNWDEMSYPVGTDEEELPYPIGVANLETLTGSSFNEQAWLDTPQYIYIGDEDNPEPGSDGHRNFWNLHDEEAQEIPPEERSYAMPELIDDIYGVKRLEERFEVSRKVYENVGAATMFTIYEGYGHTHRPAVDDLIEFHRNEIQTTYGSTAMSEDTSAGAGDESSAGDTADDGSGGNDTTSTSTNEESPGFGLGATLSGIAGAGYMLKRRVESDS